MEDNGGDAAHPGDDEVSERKEDEETPVSTCRVLVRRCPEARYCRGWTKCGVEMFRVLRSDMKIECLEGTMMSNTQHFGTIGDEPRTRYPSSRSRHTFHKLPLNVTAA